MDGWMKVSNRFPYILITEFELSISTVNEKTSEELSKKKKNIFV